VPAHELLHVVELPGQQTEVGLGRDEQAGHGEAVRPLLGRQAFVLEEVEVVVDPDERSRTLLDRPADREELQLCKLKTEQSAHFR